MCPLVPPLSEIWGGTCLRQLNGAGAYGRVAAPPGITLQGRHLRGENLEFWRLHCNVNVLAQVFTYFFILILLNFNLFSAPTDCFFFFSWRLWERSTFNQLTFYLFINLLSDNVLYILYVNKDSVARLWCNCNLADISRKNGRVLALKNRN